MVVYFNILCVFVSVLNNVIITTDIWQLKLETLQLPGFWLKYNCMNHRSTNFFILIFSTTESIGALLEPLPGVTGPRQGDTLIPCTGATWRETTIPTNSYGQFKLHNVSQECVWTSGRGWTIHADPGHANFTQKSPCVGQITVKSFALCWLNFFGTIHWDELSFIYAVSHASFKTLILGHAAFLKIISINQPLLKKFSWWRRDPVMQNWLTF